MELISSLFQTIRDIMSGFGETLVSLFDDITTIFFSGNSIDGYTFTPVGILTLCAFGIGLIWTGIRWLTRLIKMRG